jgi:hypothetical protein
MSSIVGPFAGVEDDYRREQISGSFRSHRKSGAKKLFHRRAPKAPDAPVDWFAA